MLRAGEVLGIPFGTPEPEASRRLVSVLGPPTESGETTLGGGVGTYQTFGDLSVLSFEATPGAGDLELDGWLLGPGDGGWTTESGISVGSTEEAVLAAYPGTAIAEASACSDTPHLIVDGMEFSFDPANRTVDGIGSPSFSFC